MKKLVSYFRLYWYFATNWNPVLASFIIYQDIRGERKYHIETSAPIELKDLSVGSNDISKSSRYEAVNYFILEDLLRKIRLMTKDEKFIDLGCGKGRAMVVAAHAGFNSITGIDFASELCEMAKANMETTKQYVPQLQFRVLCENVLDYLIEPDDSVFFMFNPFEEETIRKFLRKVNESIKLYPREIYFLYVSPKYMETFFQFEYEAIYRIKKLKWLEGLILKKNARK